MHALPESPVIRERLAHPRLRVVGHLQMRLPPRASPHAVRNAIEDALATADFADVGRLVIVRRLALSHLGADLTGPALRRAIELAWRREAARAVHFAAPDAAAAAAVYFVDANAAAIAWLRTWALGGPLHAWFWRRAVPEFAHCVPVERAAALVAERLCRTAPLALAGALAALPLAAAWRLERELPAALQARQAGTPTRSARSAQASPGRHAVGMEPAGRADSPGEQPGSLAAPTPSRRQSPRRSVDQSGATSVISGTTPVDMPARQQSAPTRPHDPAIAAPTAPPQVRAASEELHVTRAASQRVPPPHASPRFPWLAAADSSRHAGLLFLMRAALAVGLPAWLAVHRAEDPCAFVRALFIDLARRLRLDEADPHWTLWAGAGSEPRAVGDVDVAVWRRRMRRYLRLEVGVGIASVAARAGHVAISETHVDVILPLASTDLRLRRAGLDIDPGWLPWFGRIVAFHYLETAVDAR